MLKGKGGYIMVAYAFLFATSVSQEKKVKKLLDHGKPVLLTKIGDGKNDVFVMPKETDDGVLLENVYGNDILVGEEETTTSTHKDGTPLYKHIISGAYSLFNLVIISNKDSAYSSWGDVASDLNNIVSMRSGFNASNAVIQFWSSLVDGNKMAMPTNSSSEAIASISVVELNDFTSDTVTPL